METVTSNYEKMKQSMSKVFLQYPQEKMIEKFSLESDRDYLYLWFFGRKYRISRSTGIVQWSEDLFQTAQEADYNEAMTIYDVLCNAKDTCHLSHEFVNINTFTTVKTGTLNLGSGFFQNTADFFNGKTKELEKACQRLSGQKLKGGDVAYQLDMFPFLPVTIRFWEADEEFPASLQILADKNTPDYMHYETLMFALSHLFERLKKEVSHEKR